MNRTSKLMTHPLHRNNGFDKDKYVYGTAKKIDNHLNPGITDAKEREVLNGAVVFERTAGVMPMERVSGRDIFFVAHRLCGRLCEYR